MTVVLPIDAPTRGPAREGDRLATPGQLTAFAAALLGVAAFLSLSIGSTGITLTALPRVLAAMITGQDDAAVAREQLVLVDIRLPRLLLGLFVGAALAVSGAMMQGMFRNPLADPGLVGVSSGAALAAVATIALGNGLAAPWAKAFGVYALPFSAFLGGIATTADPGRDRLAAGPARHQHPAAGRHRPRRAQRRADGPHRLRQRRPRAARPDAVDARQPVRRQLAEGRWRSCRSRCWWCSSCPGSSAALNGLLLGEAEAFHLGIDVEHTKRLIVLITAAAVGAAVAVAGVVGFVGIVIPHLIRLLAGPDHRVVLPASALLGGSLVLIADVARACCCARPSCRSASSWP